MMWLGLHPTCTSSRLLSQPIRELLLLPRRAFLSALLMMKDTSLADLWGRMGGGLMDRTTTWKQTSKKKKKKKKKYITKSLLHCISRFCLFQRFCRFKLGILVPFWWSFLCLFGDFSTFLAFFVAFFRSTLHLLFLTFSKVFSSFFLPFNGTFFLDFLVRHWILVSGYSIMYMHYNDVLTNVLHLVVLQLNRGL